MAAVSTAKPYRPDQYIPKIERDYLLVSVQRSGTRFLQRILTAAGIKTAQIHPVPTRTNQLDGWLAKNKAEDLPIIVPMRHPFSVAHSWRNRSEPVEKMFEQYRYLTEICEQSKSLFLPVDHRDRDFYLAHMALELDTELETDWEPYGHKNGCSYLDPDEQRQIAELVASPFVSKFYNGSVPHGT